jgi:hypothetical protein
MVFHMSWLTAGRTDLVKILRVVMVLESNGYGVTGEQLWCYTVTVMV